MFSLLENHRPSIKRIQAFVFLQHCRNWSLGIQHIATRRRYGQNIHSRLVKGVLCRKRLADCMEVALAEYIREKNWKQPIQPRILWMARFGTTKLSPLFPIAASCSISLTDSNLMVPIKSLVGVIGTGTNVPT